MAPVRLMIRCWFDGSCESDTGGGPMGIGALIKIGEKVVFEYADYIEAAPENSSAYAEYTALLAVLNFLHFKNYMGASHDIKIHGDSKMVIEQINGRQRLKANEYIRIVTLCKIILARYGNRAVRIEWHPREWNKKADELSKKISREKKFNLKTQIK